ncbi:AMIN-like domain-containing (lipo)protein [Georgenia muralis]
MKRSTITATTGTALLLVLTACGGGPSEPAAPPATGADGTGSPTTAAPSPTATATATATAGGTAEPAEETDEPGEDVVYSTDAQNDPEWPSGGGDLLPVAVRAGAHEGFERVVLDFEGTGTPGWRVEYVDVAIEDPRGTEIDIDGDATLQVVATGVRIPEEDELDRVLPSGEVDVEETDAVEEVYVTGIFEGQNQAFIGLDSERPFRVFTLTDPSRLVVDIQTED